MPVKNTMNHPLLLSLKDDTRLKIISCLAVYGQLTLKELSEIIGKGKTTIHHHIKKNLNDFDLIHYDHTQDDDYREINKRTRSYFLNKNHPFVQQLFHFIEKDKISLGELKTQVHMVDTWINMYIDHLESNKYFKRINIESDFDTFLLPFDEELKEIIQEYEARLKQKLLKEQERFLRTNKQSEEVVAIVNMKIPIKEILDKRSG